MTSSVEEWVDEVARTTHPDAVIWCDGSEAENGRLIGQMVDDATFAQFGDRLPPELGNHHQALHARLTRVAV